MFFVQQFTRPAFTCTPQGHVTTLNTPMTEQFGSIEQLHDIENLFHPAQAVPPLATLLEASHNVVRYVDAHGRDVAVITTIPTRTEGLLVTVQPGQPWPEAIPAERMPMTVLLVEDDPTNRAIATAMMKKADITVHTAEDADIAYEKVLEHRYDVILMDINLPGRSGIEAAYTIRQYEVNCGYSPAPIIALTAYDDFQQQLMLHHTVLDDYLHKPVEASVLVRTLTRWRGYYSQRHTPAATRPTSAHETTINRQTLEQVRTTLGPEYTAFIAGFLNESAHQISTLTTALHHQDFSRAHDAAHALYSAAGYVGCDGLALIARDIAYRTRQQETFGLDAAMQVLQKYFSEARTVLGVVPVS